MDDDRPEKPKPHEIGMVLDALSIEELQERIAILSGEIDRLRKAIDLKDQSRSAADAVFKF